MKNNHSWIALVMSLASLSVCAQKSETQAPNESVRISPARPLPATTPAPVARNFPLSTTGTVQGYVYWDTGTVKHQPVLSCSGLTATVSTGTLPGGSAPAFEQYKQIGSSPLSPVNIGGTLGVCAYVIHQVPVGKDLEVHISISSPSVFSVAVTPGTPPTANDPNSPPKILGGNCNKVPPAIPSAAVLGSKWWTCGNYAYNVNFVLQPPPPMPR